MKDLFDFKNYNESDFYTLLFHSDVNDKNDIELSVLHDNNNVEYVKKLLELDVDVNAIDYEGWTPLFLVESPTIAKMLIDAGGDVNHRSMTSENPLHHCPNVDVLKVLLEANADPNAQDNDGNTPLFFHHNKERIKKLLEAGADPEHKNRNGLLAHEFLENKIDKSDITNEIRQSIDLLKDAVNQKQKERMLEAINAETPIEQKTVHKRRRM